MYCVNCGAEISDDAKFCGNCGNPVKVEETKIVEEGSTLEQVETSTPTSKKVWDVFAKVGFISSFICLPLNILFFFGAIFSCIFIVFSILGFKSEIRHGKAIVGFVLHCISISILIIVMTFVSI